MNMKTETPSTPAGEASTDVLSVNGGSLQAGGSVALQLMQNGMNVNALRTHAILHKDEWAHFDTAIVDVARVRLRAVGDLINRGLTFPLADALGTTSVQWEQGSDMTDASISMTGLTDAEKDRMQFSLKSVPVPIIHKDFALSARQLAASRKSGEALDTTQARIVARIVAEKNERILFQGATMQSGGGTLYGLTTFPQRNTGSLGYNWADGATTGANIYADVMALIAALIADNMYGPYVLYVPKTYYTKLSDDFKANSDRTIMERLLAIDELDAIIPSPYLTDGANGQVVLMQATSDVVDVIDGMQPTMVSWDSHGGMMFNFKVMSILVPRLKADSTTQCGIAHFTKP